MRSSLACVAVGAALAACGAHLGDAPDRVTGDAGASPPPISELDAASTDIDIDAAAPPPSDLGVADFLDGELGGYCAEAFTCAASFPTADGAFALYFGASADACTTAYERALGASHVPGDVANGKIAYDATAARACLAGIAYGTCAEFWAGGATYPAACSTAIVGSVGSGGTCNSAYECAGTALCVARICVAP